MSWKVLFLLKLKIYVSYFFTAPEGFYLSGFPSSPLTLNFFKLVSLKLITWSATQSRSLSGLMSVSEGKLKTLGKLKNFYLG